MRLTELSPKFIRFEERRTTVCMRQPDGGDKNVTAMRPYWQTVETLAEAQGIMMLCPVCLKENGGANGTHSIVCWSKSRGVPDTADPGPGRWVLDGSSAQDLTLNGEPGKSRSVLVTGGCGAHFFVTNGGIEIC